jgi:hypothetical protein
MTDEELDQLVSDYATAAFAHIVTMIRGGGDKDKVKFAAERLNDDTSDLVAALEGS